MSGLEITGPQIDNCGKHGMIYGDRKPASIIGSFLEGREVKDDSDNAGTMVRDRISVKIRGRWFADPRLSELVEWCPVP